MSARLEVGLEPIGRYPQFACLDAIIALASFNDPSCEMGKEIYYEYCPVRCRYFARVDPYFT